MKRRVISLLPSSEHVHNLITEGHRQMNKQVVVCDRRCTGCGEKG